MRHPRLALAALPIMLTVSGCVTVDPGVSTPASTPATVASSSPSPVATPAPIVSPEVATSSPSASAQPTGSPEPTASAAHTATSEPATTSPTAPPSEGASESPSGDPVSSDSTRVFGDSFDDDANGWGVVEVEGFGSIEWFDGALAFAAESVQGSLQSTKPVAGGETWNELAGSVDFTPIEGSDSLMGIYCSPGDETLIGGLVGVDGTWLVIAGTQQSVTVIDRGELPEGAMAVGQTSTVAFQCSGADDVLLPMVRVAVGADIVATTEIPAEYASMPAFSTVGLWAEPVTPPMLVGADEVQVVGRQEPRRENLGPPPTAAP